MKLNFVDDHRIIRWISDLRKTNLGNLRFWHYTKTKLPANFEDLTQGEVLKKYYIEKFLDLEETRRIKDPDAEDLERLSILEKLFSLKDLDVDTAFSTGDPEVDKWEQQIAAGQTPDWDD